MAGHEKKLEHRVDENGCWICTSHALNAKGYICITRNGKRTYAHRHMFEQHHGAIPEGHVIRHQCDVPSCINPEHLKSGTAYENIQDRVNRKRGACGERINKAKLSSEDVAFIRGDTTHTAKELAKRFGVTETTIYRAKNGKSWAHI